MSWFAVGDYKRRANMAGGRETAKPKDVPAKMRSLLSEYNQRGAVHADRGVSAEHTHPQGDEPCGNFLLSDTLLCYNPALKPHRQRALK